MALWLLVACESYLLWCLVWSRRYRTTPLFFLFVIFAIGSALTYDPFDVGFTTYMSRLSDWMKAAALSESFLLLSLRMDRADRVLSAVIGICVAGAVTAAAQGLPSRVSFHMKTLIWMASFALAMIWWAWKRGDRLELWVLRHSWLLTGYLVVKAGAVVAWSFTAGRNWSLINGAAELAEALIFALWVRAGPCAQKKPQIASHEGDTE